MCRCCSRWNKRILAEIKDDCRAGSNEHSNTVPLLNALDKNGQRSLLKASEVCAMFKISKPTLYNWMNHGKLPSIKIESRRFFRFRRMSATFRNFHNLNS